MSSLSFLKKIFLWKTHWIVLVFSLVITFLIWSYTKNQREEKFQAIFYRESNQAVELIVERMKKYEDALQSGVAFARSYLGDISYYQWQDYAGLLKIEKKLPGIMGVGIIYKVVPEELPSYLEKQRRHRPNFNIHPPHQNKIFYPITYIEPQLINQKAVGLDMAHETNRYTAVVNARDSGQPQITGPIVLVQDENKTPGFLLFVPFYQSKMPPETLEERQKNFQGIVYAPFIVSRLMKGTLEKAKRNLGIRISDGDNLLHNELVPSDPDYDPRPLFSNVKDIKLYGRVWRFRMESGKSFRRMNQDSQPTAILIAGLCVDMLLFGLFFMKSVASRLAQANVVDIERKNSQLMESQEKLEKSSQQLRERESQLEQQRMAALNIAEDAKAALVKAEVEREKALKIFDMAPSGLLIVDEVLDIQELNSEAARILAQSSGDLLGQSFPGFFLEPFRTLGEVETKICFTKGELSVPCDIKSTPLSLRGHAIHLISLVDISERIEFQNRFKIAVDSAPSAMVMVNHEGAISLVNAEAERIFGYDREELLGQNIENLIPYRFRNQHGSLMGNFFSNPTKREMGASQELFGLRKNQSEFPVEIGLTPIKMPDGNYVISSIIDNTQHVRLLEELKNRSEEMEQLLYTVSHDLKSPLVTIEGFSSILQESLSGGDTEGAESSAKRINRSVKLMGEIINDLMQLGKVGHESESPEELDMASLVDDSIQALDALLDSTHANVNYDTALPKITGIRIRYLKIFINLLSNAVKYGSVDGNCTIHIGYDDTTNYHKFYVHDRGPGIPLQQHERVFKLFKQLDNKREGSGLGMAIVLKAARSMGGGAWIDTEVDQGCKIWFSAAKNYFEGT